MQTMSDHRPGLQIADSASAAAPIDSDGVAVRDECASTWSYTVSVRELCEFSAKRGDLDRRFTPSATALEGIMGQNTVARRRGPDYESEIALAGICGPLRVRAGPTATTLDAFAWRKSRRSVDGPMTFRKTGASCTGRSWRPTARCSAANAS